jgi:hypothetical protein
MDTERGFVSRWVFTLAGAVAIPMALLIAYLGARQPMPGQAITAIAALLVIYLSLMLLGTIMAPTAGERTVAGTAELAMEGFAADGEVAELELMDAVPVSLMMPVTLGVTRASGVCPLGFRPGHTWVVGVDGHLSRPLCAPAVTASTAILEEWSAVGLRIAEPCHCPVGRELVFAVQDGT